MAHGAGTVENWQLWWEHQNAGVRRKDHNDPSWSGGLIGDGSSAGIGSSSPSAGARQRIASSISSKTLDVQSETSMAHATASNQDLSSAAIRAEEAKIMKAAGHSSRLSFSAYPDSLRYSGEILGAVSSTYMPTEMIGADGRAGQGGSIDMQKAIGENRYVMMTTTVPTPGRMGSSSEWTSDAGNWAGQTRSAVGASGAMHGMWTQDLRAAK